MTSYIDAGILNRTLTYDDRGLVDQITDHLDATRNQLLGYDELGRVESAAGSYGSLAWQYRDGTGDRQTETRKGVTDTYAYAAGTHRVQSISGGKNFAFTYDAAGNTSKRLLCTITPSSRTSSSVSTARSPSRPTVKKEKCPRRDQ
jgi:hypothetical protein